MRQNVENPAGAGGALLNVTLAADRTENNTNPLKINGVPAPSEAEHGARQAGVCGNCAFGLGSDIPICRKTIAVYGGALQSREPALVRMCALHSFSHPPVMRVSPWLTNIWQGCPDWTPSDDTAGGADG